MKDGGTILVGVPGIKGFKADKVHWSPKNEQCAKLLVNPNERK